MFEESMVVLSDKELKLDIATVTPGAPQTSSTSLLTEGLTAAEARLEQKLKGHGYIKKVARELGFPLDVIVHGYHADCTTAQATVESDRIRILNTIIGVQPELIADVEPDLTHGNCKRVNQTLRGMIAEAAVNTAIRCGQVDDALCALAQNQDRAVLVLNAHNTEIIDIPELEHLFASQPLLQRLTMNCSGCPRLNNANALGRALPLLAALRDLSLLFSNDMELEDIHELGVGLGAVCSLESLVLELGSCKRLTDLSSLNHALSQLSSLQILRVDLMFCESIRVPIGAAGLPRSLRELRVDFGMCENLEDLSQLGSALAGLANLQTLRLDFTGCPMLTHLESIMEGVASAPVLIVDLDWTQCESMSDAVVEASALATSPHLQQLNLEYDFCDGLQELKFGAGPRLEKLVLSSSFCGQISSISSIVTEELPNLRWFELVCVSCTQLHTMAGVYEMLRRAPALEVLSMSVTETKIRDLDQLGSILVNLSLHEFVLNARKTPIAHISAITTALARSTLLQKVSIDLSCCLQIPSGELADLCMRLSELPLLRCARVDLSSCNMEEQDKKVLSESIGAQSKNVTVLLPTTPRAMPMGPIQLSGGIPPPPPPPFRKL